MYLKNFASGIFLCDSRRIRDPIGAGILGIWMTYKGYGVWAMAMLGLINAAVDTVILWITVGWRPQFDFSMTRYGVCFHLNGNCWCLPW